MASLAQAIPSREEFEQAALDYYASLTPEDFMESTDQHTQNIITDASLGLVTQQWPEFQCFGDLLIQYLHKGKMARVTPDNLILLSKFKVEKRLSINLPHDDFRPVMVVEYVSEGKPNKDYVQSFAKYEKELCVKYYLTFHPPKQDLRLHILEGGTYVRVEQNTDGRLAVQDLNLEVAIHEGWARWWYQGKLLSLPTELAQQAKQHLERAIKAEKRAEKEKQLAEKQKQRAEQEKQRADEERQRAVQEKQRAEQEKQRAEQEKQRAEEQRQRADQEKQRAAALEAQVAELLAKLKEKADASGNGSHPPASP